MTNFLRYTYLSLVAYATLAIILLIAFAPHAEDLKPSAETKDGTRQIVVEEAKAKPTETATPAKDEAAAEPAKTAEAAPAPEAQAESGAPAPEAPVAEAAPAPKPQIVLLPKPKPYIAYVHRYSGYGYHSGYDHCD